MKYKKLYLVGIILLFTSLSSSGQTHIGVFAGLNSSKLSGDAPNQANYASLMGANLGAYIDFSLSDNFILGVQPSYSQEGTRIIYSISPTENNIDSIHVRLNYFSLPVLFKVLTSNNRFYAIGGLEFGYLVDDFEKIGDVESELPVNTNDWNFALHFGAGMKIPLGLPNLIIELRYTQGLDNITDTPLQDSYIPRVKTSGLKLIVGIEIALQKSSKQKL